MATAAVIRLELEHGVHRSADDCLTEEGTIVRENRRVGRGGEFVQRYVGLVRNPCRVDVHQMPEDRAVRRQSCGIYQNVFKRQLIVPSQFDPPCQWREFAAHLLQPKPLIRRIPVDDRDGFCERQHAQDILEGRGEVVRNGNHRIVFRQPVVLDPALLHRRKHHRRCWKQPLTMALDEVGGGRADGDDEINRSIGIKAAKIFYKCGFRFFIIPPGIHQRVVEKVHRLSPLPADLRANGLFVIAPGFETRAKRMQHHDPFGRCIGQAAGLRGQQECNNQ